MRIKRHRGQGKDGSCGQDGIAQQWPWRGIGAVAARDAPSKAPGEQLAEGIGASEWVGQQARGIRGVGDGEDDNVSPGSGGQVGGNRGVGSSVVRASSSWARCAAAADASGLDPFSGDQTVRSLTPHAAARVAVLAPADWRAARRTAPATIPVGLR